MYPSILSSALLLGTSTFALPTANDVSSRDMSDSATLVDPSDISLNQRQTGLPFTKMVAFGDDYTDDSSGSYAHDITGTPKKLWGYGTWTDGPIAATFLSQQLGLPLTDYAWGSSGGGEKIGSVCSNALIPASNVNAHAMYNGAVVPDALQQIQTYGLNKTGIKDTLHFFWTGNNDVIASLGWLGRFTICIDGLCLPGQQKFIDNVANCMLTGLRNLVNQGARYIVVPNIYPRHLTPWTSMWIVQNPAYIANFGSVIDQVNAKLKANIAMMNKNQAYRGVKILYYDVNAYMKATSANPPAAGIDGPGYPYTCVDGCVKQNPTNQKNWAMYWNNTVINRQPDNFYWFTEVVASSTVHRAIASQMAVAISNFFG